MIELKLSACIQQLALEVYHVESTDFLIYSTRTHGVLRVSAELMKLITCGYFTLLPDALMVLLLKFEIVIPLDIVEADFLYERTVALHMDKLDDNIDVKHLLTDTELLNYSREQLLINF